MGVWQEIVDYTIATNTAEFTINLPETLTKDNFYKFVYTVNPNNTTNFTEWGVFPNGLARSNTLSWQTLFGDGSSVGSGRRGDNGLGYANGRGPGQLNGQPGIFMGYIKITENNVYNEFANFDRQSATDLMNFFVVRTVYSTTYPSGVNSLTYRIFSDTGTTGFTTGSRLQIYKLMAEKVADITVTSTTAQVDMSNLSIDKDSEYLLINYINNTSTGVAYFPYFNDNFTNSTYNSQTITGNGSTKSAVRSNVPILAEADNEPSLVYSYIKLSNIGAITMQNYELRGVGKGTPVSSAKPILNNRFISTVAENITSINKISVRTSNGANQIFAGSRFELYKIY